MKIFVTRKIPEPGLDLLRKEFTIVVNSDNRVLTKEEIINGIKGSDGLLCLLTDQIDREVIYEEAKLKMIASYAVGYDNIDIPAATERGIPVSNTPGVLTDTTAEHAWALLFSVARRIVEGDTLMRTGKFKGWAPLLMHGRDITAKTLGVIGTGRIGTAFALKSKGFKMNVLYYDNVRNQKLEDELSAKKVELDRLLQKSDFIPVHLPYLHDTHHLIGERQLKRMRKTTILIMTFQKIQ